MEMLFSHVQLRIAILYTVCRLLITQVTRVCVCVCVRACVRAGGCV